MQIGRTLLGTQTRIVSFSDGSWQDITDALATLTPPVHSIANLIETGRLSTAALTPLAAASPNIAEPGTFCLPLVPSKVVCLGRNYAEHARELGNAVPEEPVLFNKTPNTFLPDNGVVAFDSELGRVDYEGEIALVIGPDATVAGYTLLNDVTARDLQATDKTKGLPWFKSKNLDTFCPMGPLVRLADSLPADPELDLELRVNGQVRQHGNTRQFIFDVPEMLAYIARFVNLVPGDLVATGTPPGVGPLRDGDRIEVYSPQIGTLRSSVRTEPRKPRI